MEDVPTPLRFFNECHAAEMFIDDGVESVTSVEQVSGGRD